MKTNMERWWNGTDRGKNPKYSEKNISQSHFVYHKFHIDWTGIENRTCGVRGSPLNAYAKTRSLSTAISLSSFSIFSYGILNLLETTLELIIISVTKFQTIDKIRSDYELKIYTAMIKNI